MFQFSVSAPLGSKWKSHLGCKWKASSREQEGNGSMADIVREACREADTRASMWDYIGLGRARRGQKGAVVGKCTVFFIFSLSFSDLGGSLLSLLNARGGGSEVSEKEHRCLPRNLVPLPDNLQDVVRRALNTAGWTRYGGAMGSGDTFGPARQFITPQR
ncbi:hypothetical protein FIBSPDRAFT_987777 [Athelia psychrophila]|uniref:Uncharacterized protein n=1 Tax=Athelia psychrophila TaxID=1759441 RepID=A0A166AFQ9_9AGAM|nr:hypothetical protein FIBSPDRAFT_987777 [Fibularhizoctonia sp. CBS 109695]